MYATGSIPFRSRLVLNRLTKIIPRLYSEARTQALSPEEFRPFKISSIKKLNHNTSMFRLELGASQRSGVFATSSIKIQIPSQDGEEVISRSYTCITDESSLGYMELPIKNYTNGVVSSYIFSLQVGDKMYIRGPLPKIRYTSNMVEEIGMIAGGTGITPMLQIINSVVNNPQDTTKISVLFANVAEEDIVLRENLESAAEARPDKIKIHYVLDRPPQGWNGETGYITAEMIKKYMPSSELGSDAMILVCGPPKMMDLVSSPKTSSKDQGELSGLLKELGYTKENVYKF